MAIGLSKLLIAVPVALISGLIGGASTCAEVTTDGTVGPRIRLPRGDFEIGADLGTRAGRNLFHSFERFSLATGERATFSGPDQIQNVISRVTGGERSDIDGTIRSTIAGADFYFINRADVLFGPNASLDLKGSFHVSTADELRFRDGAKFSADLDARSSFTVERPEAFGFLGGDRGTLSVTDSQLRVQAGEVISLVGGAVTIASGSPEESPTLDASRGTITVGAVGAGSGQFAIRSGQLETPDRAPITIADAVLDTTGAGGGAIRIEGGRLLIDNSIVSADNRGSSDATGGIEIKADRVTLRDGSIVTADALASGNGGQVRVDATRVAIRSGSFFGSDVRADGNGGTVDVEADSILISRDGAEGFTGMGTDVRSGTGQGGQTTVHARGLRVLDGGQISSSTLAEGDAGTVKIKATGLVEVREGGQISSSTFAEGDAGTVKVTAGRVLVDAEGTSSKTGISSQANRNSSGDAGTVTINATGLVEVRQGGQISSSTLAERDAGTVKVTAGRVLIDGAGSPIATSIASQTEPKSSGDAGTVTINATGLVEVRQGGQITSSTLAEGDAGTVKVTAGRVLVDAQDSGEGGPSFFSTSIGAQAGGIAGGIGEPQGESVGNAGRVTIKATERVTVRDGGLINSSTFGRDAGEVTVTAPVVLVDGAGSGFPTGIISEAATSASGSVGQGDAGGVRVQAETIEMVEGGSVSSSADGPGRAGDVVILATDRLIAADASITTDSQTGGGGEIRLLVDEVIDLRDSAVTTSVAGGADPTAGNVEIGEDIDGTRRPTLLVIDSGSRIQANAPVGFGGHLTIIGDSIVIPEGDFQALVDRGDISATGGDPSRAGTVVVNAPDVDLSAGLVVLEGAFVEVARLRERCETRRDIGASSFTGVGRGGLPPSPDGPLASAYIVGEAALGDVRKAGSRGTAGTAPTNVRPVGLSAPPCVPLD